jgi:hypothetical protein
MNRHICKPHKLTRKPKFVKEPTHFPTRQNFKFFLHLIKKKYTTHNQHDNQP